MLCDEEKIQYDAEYVENLCFLYELKILIGTLVKVFTSDGILMNTHKSAEDEL